MLSSSGITKEEVAAHPQAVVDVLQVCRVCWCRRWRLGAARADVPVLPCVAAWPCADADSFTWKARLPGSQLASAWSGLRQRVSPASSAIAYEQCCQCMLAVTSLKRS